MVHREDCNDAIPPTRSQDEYNKAIKECDIFVQLFFTKVGKYTEEEFDIAYREFQETHKPFIYTYFKHADISTANKTDDVLSLINFKNKLSSLKHFYSTYKSSEDLQLQFNQQLNKLVEEGIIQFTVDNPHGKLDGQSRKDNIGNYLTPQPFILSVFEDRDEDLTAVHQRLFTQNNQQALFLVNGQGGIGKTSLAAKYRERYQDKYQHSAWLYVQASIQNTLLALALPLKLTFAEELNNKERLDLLLRALANLDKACLLILEYVNDK